MNEKSVRMRVCVISLILIAGALAACNRPMARSTVAAQTATSGGCVPSTAPGDHVSQCAGLRVDARVPATCAGSGCGLILELHGDTGTGLLADAHVQLRERGAQDGYIVVMPTGPAIPAGGPGSTWFPENDDALIEIVRQFTSALHADPKKIHVTGFSRGGFVTWRLLCDHADLFASAAPGAAGSDVDEKTCFSRGRTPSRHVPISLLMGRTDHQVSYRSMVAIRDAAIAAYHAAGPQLVRRDGDFAHNRWTSADGAVIETLEHSYETDASGPWGFALGHCVPGSTSDPRASQYALPCRPPNAFVWGEEVMRFFRAHPMS